MINSECCTALLERLKGEIRRKKNSHKSRKKCSFTKTMQHVTNRLQRLQNYMNCSSNWFCTTFFSRSGPQRHMVVCKSQKNALGKEIWFQWRSDIASWGVFYAKDKSFYKKKASNCLRSVGIRILEWEYIEEWSRILPKSCCFISYARDLLSDVLSGLFNK